MFPGEQGILLGFLNSFVHIFMYFYYMVAAMGPRYRKYLWWKKYMTWIQLIQFTIMLTYLVLLVALDCKFSRTLTFFFVGNVVIFLYLFGSFYVKTYKSKKVSNETLDQNENLQITDKNSDKKQDWLFKYICIVQIKTKQKIIRVVNCIIERELYWIAQEAYNINELHIFKGFVNVICCHHIMFDDFNSK